MTASPLRQIFLSSVTGEFGDQRRLLKADLSLPRVKVQEQADLVQGGGKLLQTLDDYIRDDCDAVIHLVGRKTGQPLKPDELRWLRETYPEFVRRFPFLAEQLTDDPPTLTYTQMEAWLALWHRKRCHLYRPSELDDSPLPADHPQHVHWERIRGLGEHRGTFDDPQHLCRQVLRDLHNLFPRDVPQSHRPVALPYHSIGTLFKGREKFLLQLRASLQRIGDGQATAIVGRAVHGLGGVGKTRLAVEYAWQHADDFSAVLFVTADSPENLRRELAALAGPLVLDLPEHAATEEEARVAAALRWLNDHPGWFMILDNVDTEDAARYVETLLARLSGGQVLITSRLGKWCDVVQPLELDVLADEDGATFLLEKTRPQPSGRGRKPVPSDESDALELARELDGLALALEQAGAYIAQLRMSLPEYLTLWRSHAPKVQEWFDRTIQYAGPSDKPLRSVAVTWQTTLDQLSQHEIQLLDLLAWFAPEPVPMSVFSDPSALSTSLRFEKKPASAQDAWSADSFREALANLADFSMIRWDATAETVSVHRVVQEILRTQQAEPDRFLTAVLRLLDAALPEEIASDVRTWPAWEPLRPHVAFATAEADERKIDEPTSFLMGELGTLLSAKALHAEAEQLKRRALAIDQRHHGPDSTQVAVRLNNLAQTLQATNRLAEAEPMMRRALAIDEQSFGADHPKVALRLNNLATLLQATNRLAEAEPLMRRALAIDEQSYGAEHPRVAIELNNLAQLLKATNRLAEAEPMMRRALAIDEQSYGAEHPDVAIDLNNLAQLLKATNRLAEAEPLMRRALAIDEQSYGAEHPLVAIRLNNLALLLQATNRLTEAEPMMRRAVDIFRASLGDEHPNTVTVAKNYRLLREAMGLAE